MENSKLYQAPINYESESVYITLECRNYLLENNFYENSESKNIELLEQALINYSIIKLAEWSNEFSFEKNINIENWDNLPSILTALNNQIPTQQEKNAFFAQYTHCILNLVSLIQKQSPIEWKTNAPHSYNYAKVNDGKITEIITSDLIPPHIIPIKVLETIKSYYPTKKNPVLKK